MCSVRWHAYLVNGNNAALVHRPHTEPREGLK
jgi:hypothetical protein